MDKIEILSVDLLDEHRALVSDLRRMERALHQEFGWHYLLDLVWIISNLDPDRSDLIVDAGAGLGILQWYLAEQGRDVLSIDRRDRAHLNLRFRSRYRVAGLRPEDLSSHFAVMLNDLKSPFTPVVKAKKLARSLTAFVRMLLPPAGEGRVTIYNQDLRTLVDLADDSVDALVAVSALEHNTPEDLNAVVAELMRVLKPGGRLLATLGAAREDDWFHEPSKGWNYSEASLRRIFDLPDEAPSNYYQHDRLFAGLKNNAELRDNLAGYYRQAGNRGMPWGVWNPEYIPVGVCKIKA